MNESDYFVTYIHFRLDDQATMWPYRRGQENWEPRERGGGTLCLIKDKETKEVLATGLSERSSLDHFNYSRGRTIAKNRATIAMNGGQVSFNTPRHAKFPNPFYAYVCNGSVDNEKFSNVMGSYNESS